MSIPNLQILRNARAATRSQPPDLAAWLSSEMFSGKDCEQAMETISEWEGYRPTPLSELTDTARAAGVRQVLYKDEAERLGLKSFKALGGAYAVQRLLERKIQEETGAVSVSTGDLTSGKYSNIAQRFPVAAATAGNHGRSVAWGAQSFGCPCMIYVHRGVSRARADAIAAFGASIVRVDGDYDDSVRAAATDAAANGWTVVSDTSYPGYDEIPRMVMLGYTVMLDEVVEQLHGRLLTHVIVQAGVGGLAAATAAFFALCFGSKRPSIIVVEPEKSDGLYQSALNGEPRKASGPLGSVMLGMDCGEVSLVAWKVLDRLADYFVLISDNAAIDALRKLNATDVETGPIVAGECSGAGLAVLHAVTSHPELKVPLGLDEHSIVLLLGTEGATDPESLNALLKE